MIINHLTHYQTIAANRGKLSGEKDAALRTLVGQTIDWMFLHPVIYAGIQRKGVCGLEGVIQNVTLLEGDNYVLEIAFTAAQVGFYHVHTYAQCVLLGMTADDRVVFCQQAEREHIEGLLLSTTDITPAKNNQS